jgi:hypothetical protein
MMGRLKSEQGQLFYRYDLNDAVPEDHLVRMIDARTQSPDGAHRVCPPPGTSPVCFQHRVHGGDSRNH